MLLNKFHIETSELVLIMNKLGTEKKSMALFWNYMNKYIVHTGLEKIQEEWVNDVIDYFFKMYVDPICLDYDYNAWIRSYMERYLDVAPTYINDDIIDTSPLNENTKTLHNNAVSNETIYHHHLFEVLREYIDDGYLFNFESSILAHFANTKYEEEKNRTVRGFIYTPETIINRFAVEYLQKLKSHIFCINLKDMQPLIVLLHSDHVDTESLDNFLQDREHIFNIKSTFDIYW